MTDELKPLSQKHQAVLDEYLICWSKTKAYEKIYPSASHSSSKASAARLFTDVNFLAHLQQRLEDNHMSADEVLGRLADMARSDVTNFMDLSTTGFSLSLVDITDDGTLTPKPGTHVIKKIKQKTTTYLAKSSSQEDREVHEIEIELYSAKEALELVGKHHKLFNEPGSKENPLHIEGLDKVLDRVWSQPSKPTNE